MSTFWVFRAKRDGRFGYGARATSCEFLKQKISHHARFYYYSRTTSLSPTREIFCETRARTHTKRKRDIYIFSRLEKRIIAECGRAERREIYIIYTSHRDNRKEQHPLMMMRPHRCVTNHRRRRSTRRARLAGKTAPAARKRKSHAP